MMLKRKTLLNSFAIAALVLSTPVMAQTASPLDGKWRVAEALGAGGVYTDDSLAEAQATIGKEIEFDGRVMELFNGLSCEIESAATETLTDYDFGSQGGSWSRIGLKPIAPDSREYRVTKITYDCEDADEDQQASRQLMIGNRGNLFLLNVWETWVRLDRIGRTLRP